MKNKNVLLLTIAVVTVFVAIIGASYAYFSATANAGTHKVEVTTPQVQTASISNGTMTVEKSITGAEMEQLGHDEEYPAETNSEVKLMATESGQRFCYTVQLSYDAHDFTYSTTDHTKPEVKVEVTKNNTYTFSQDITSLAKVENKYLNDSLEMVSEGVPIHVIHATGSGNFIDNWKIKLSFYNYTGYSQTQNQSKIATAGLVLTTAECPPVKKRDIIASLNSKGLSNAKEGGLYRYQETKGNVNNYLCFGTNSKDECVNNPNNYMYRIIGINDIGDIKVIKNTSIGDMVWGNIHNVDTKWNESVVYQNINGASFLNNETYIPNNTWKSAIVKKNWPMPTLSPDDRVNKGTAQNLYQKEILDQPDTNKVLAKIGLMYVHDYYYSLKPGGHDCSLSSMDYEKCLNSWFNNGLEEWTMVYHGQGTGGDNVISYFAYNLRSPRGYLHTFRISKPRAVRPVFYITKYAKISSGIGTISDPFILDTSDIRSIDDPEFDLGPSDGGSTGRK